MKGMASLSLLCLLPASALLASCQRNETVPAAMTQAEKAVAKMTIKVQSTAFAHEATIPTKYTCDGQDISPPLVWSGVPKKAEGLTLIADDPDAPRGTWVHWVLFNLPADVTKLVEDVPSRETLENGARQGMNDFKKIGYGGPCPPKGHGAHRYFFKIYALDTKLDLQSGATKDQLLRATDGHVLAGGQLMGKYSRQ
jgi:Raf kinase inhibitor-like YbhB/YbcL family protein